MRANTVSLQGSGERRPCFPWPRGWKVQGGKPQGLEGFSCPGCLGGILASVGDCSAVAVRKAGWSTMCPVDPRQRARRVGARFLIPGPDLTPKLLTFLRRTVLMDTVGSGKWRKRNKRRMCTRPEEMWRLRSPVTSGHFSVSPSAE